jgi:S-adenosylmethionine:tRNA ribosyltransferase-isomerase
VKAASSPRAASAERLLYIDPARREWRHHRAGELVTLLSPGDLLVVNDAATMPASLTVEGGEVEVRLLGRGETDQEWTAVLFGRGDFRMPTEQRPDPPRLARGARLDFGDRFSAEVTRVDAGQPRLIGLRFDRAGAALWLALYRKARPVQYAYLERELPLWHFQNRYASRPWALEMPSAGHFLTWELLIALRARGIGLAHLTHAAGISSTGSSQLDRMLPLPERYQIEAEAALSIATTRQKGGRVVAAGTTVVRALESSFAERGHLTAGQGEARLVIGPGFRPNVVDGLLSGMHEPATTHFALLEAFASRALLEPALEAADRAGYLQHEFGDSVLVLGSRPARAHDQAV